MAAARKLLLARAYAAFGSVDQAERCWKTSKEHRGRSVALHDPQLSNRKVVARAAKGAQRSAVELLAAADCAPRAGQFAVEAEALPTPHVFATTPWQADWPPLGTR